MGSGHVDEGAPRKRAAPAAWGRSREGHRHRHQHHHQVRAVWGLQKSLGTLSDLDERERCSWTLVRRQCAVQVQRPIGPSFHFFNPYELNHAPHQRRLLGQRRVRVRVPTAWPAGIISVCTVHWSPLCMHGRLSLAVGGPDLCPTPPSFRVVKDHRGLRGGFGMTILGRHVGRGRRMRIATPCSCSHLSFGSWTPQPGWAHVNFKIAL